MTTSLEAMKAARGRLQDLRESEFYWGKFLAVTRCGIHEALTLLDAAIQREEGGGDDCPVCDGARITKQEDGDEYRCRACTPTSPSEPMVPRAGVIPVCHGCDVAGMSDHVHLEDAVFLDGGGHE